MSLASFSSSFSPHVLQNGLPAPELDFYHLKEPVPSTQDEARRILHERSCNLNVEKENGTAVLVVADQQTSGRGTKGRKWEGAEGGLRKGNLYMTVCIPIDLVPVQITLLPLQIAVILAQQLERFIGESYEKAQLVGTIPMQPKTTVKWPNDVLVNDSKIAGILIENEIVNGCSWLLIGVGLNVGFTPDLQGSPGKQARRATCLQEHCFTSLSNDTARVIGVSIANSLLEWVSGPGPGDRVMKEKEVIRNWRSYAEFGKVYELRGDVAEEDMGCYQGARVIAVDIQTDGQLLVRDEKGNDRLLIADYLF